MPLRALTLMVFLLLSVPVCFLWPFYGILLWTALAFLNPQAYTFAGWAFPWAMTVAVPTLVGLPLFSRRRGKLASQELFLIVVLWIWFTITSVVSTNSPLFMHHAEATWFHWELVSKIMLMAVVTIALVDCFSRLRMLVLVIAGCFGALVLKTLPFLIRTGGTQRLYGPEYSMIADNNDFGLALNMTVPLFFFLAHTESNRWVKRLLGFLFVITIPAVFFTYSRGALLGLVAVMGLMFLQSKRRLLMVPAIAIGLGIALVLAPETWQNRMDPARPNVMDGSARARLNAWAFARHLSSDNPITGGGFATFTPTLFNLYAPDKTDIKGAHSVYFGVLAEHGYVGLFLYLALVFSCFASAHRLVKLGRYYGDKRVVCYANMFRLSLVGFLTSGAFLGRAYFDYFFVIVACIAILKGVARDEWRKRLEPVAQVAAESARDEFSYDTVAVQER